MSSARPPWVSKLLKFIPVVKAVGGLSKDRSTKVGAVAFGPGCEIRSTGYNGFPRGVDDNVEARHERPAKYKWTAHAEENVVAQAARLVLEGSTVMVDGLCPCSTCARMMINAGVSRIVVASQSKEAAARWTEDSDIAVQMFREANVEVVFLNEESQNG